MPPRRKKAAATPIEQPAPTTEPVATPPRPSATEPEARPIPPADAGEAQRTWQPDPFPLMKIALGAERNGPTMTFFRSNKYNQLAIRFDERPAAEYRERLRQDGWRWREAEGVWTKQIDRERRARSHVEAERLFVEIGQAIRADLGLGSRSAAGE